MRYLVVNADANNTGLSEAGNPFLSPTELGLSERLKKELESWVQSYQEIIPMGSEERKRNIDKIKLLDEKGIEITKKIKKELPDSKIEYYSEGLLKRIFFC